VFSSPFSPFKLFCLPYLKQTNKKPICNWNISPRTIPGDLLISRLWLISSGHRGFFLALVCFHYLGLYCKSQEFALDILIMGYFWKVSVVTYVILFPFYVFTWTMIFLIMSFSLNKLDMVQWPWIVPCCLWSFCCWQLFTLGIFNSSL